MDIEFSVIGNLSNKSKSNFENIFSNSIGFGFNINYKFNQYLGIGGGFD